MSSDMLQSVLICGGYCILSTGCILHNKYILSKILPHENLLLLAQNVFTIVFVLCVGKYNRQGETPTKVTFSNAIVPKYTLYHSRGDWIVGIFYALSVVTGMYCLAYLTVPTFSAVKKGGMLISWGFEVMNPTPTTWASLPSLLMVMGGAVVQTWYDLDFSSAGVVFGILSCVFQSASYEVGKRMVTHGKDLWSVLLINSIASLLVQLVYMGMIGELSMISLFTEAVLTQDAKHLGALTNKKSTFMTSARATLGQVEFHVLANCFLIMLMNFSIFLNCCVNSPLVHVVFGNVKGIFTTIAGIILFSLSLNVQGYAGIVTGFVGGCWFSWVKYREEMRKRAVKESADAGAAGGEEGSSKH